MCIAASLLRSWRLGWRFRPCVVDFILRLLGIQPHKDTVLQVSGWLSEWRAQCRLAEVEPQRTEDGQHTWPEQTASCSFGAQSRVSSRAMRVGSPNYAMQPSPDRSVPSLAKGILGEWPQKPPGGKPQPATFFLCSLWTLASWVDWTGSGPFSSTSI